MTQAEMFCWKVGGIDATIFFIAWLCIGAALAKPPVGILPIFVFLLVLASVIVGWRGVGFARLFLGGTASLWRAVNEGFVWGACIVFLFWLWATFNVLTAEAMPGHASPFQFAFWVEVAKPLPLFLGSGGFLGALHGVGFFYLNHWLVRANPAVKRDAPQAVRPLP